MSSRVVQAAINEAVEGRPVGSYQDASRACERAIDNLRSGHPRSYWPSTRRRVTLAWLCTPELQQRYQTDVAFHHAIDVLAQLAEAAVFDDFPLTEAEKTGRAQAVALITSGLGS